MVSRKYKILSISLKKEKKKKRYIVTLSNNNVFEVSEDVLIDKSLHINKEIYKTDLDKILLRDQIVLYFLTFEQLQVQKILR